MPSAEKPGDDEKNDVLSNLPRSRRQRPSARREQAKASRQEPSPAAGNGKGAAAPSAPAGREKATAVQKAAAEPAVHERPRKRVPAAGYATVHEPGSYGNADPDELLKSFVRGILRRLPG